MRCRTRLRVSALISEWFRRTFETVTTDTPRAWAISFIVAAIADYHTSYLQTSIPFSIPLILLSRFLQNGTVQNAGMRRQLHLHLCRASQVLVRPQVPQFVISCRQTQIFPFVMNFLTRVTDVEHGDVMGFAGRRFRPPDNCLL